MVSVDLDDAEDDLQIASHLIWLFLPFAAALIAEKYTLPPCATLPCQTKSNSERKRLQRSCLLMAQQ